MVRRFFGPAKFNERRDFRFGEEIARIYARSKSWLPALTFGCRIRSSVHREGRQRGDQA
jgi:hypothetical protein